MGSSFVFTEKIPGRQETFITEVLRIKMDVDKRLGTILDQAQAKKLSRTNLDHLGVKTGYDPFAQYLQDSMK